MTVDEKQLRLTLNHLFRSSRGNELYPALLEMLDRDALMFSTFIMKSLFFLARYFSPCCTCRRSLVVRWICFPIW